MNRRLKKMLAGFILFAGILATFYVVKPSQINSIMIVITFFGSIIYVEIFDAKR